MDPVKEAFAKVKQDIDELKIELLSLKQTLSELLAQSKPLVPTHLHQNPANQQTNTSTIPTHNFDPTHKTPLYGLKEQDKDTSTGNRGVPTNKQTNQQTNQHSGNEGVPAQITSLEQVPQLLESLDSLKREVRVKFKRLTQQEMIVFAAIYDLQERGFIVDYPLLSTHLKLTEISIRDYTRKLIQKGIPLLKSKENNKKITLSIAPELKKITSLQAIYQLREL